MKEIATEGPSPGRASFREWVAGRCAAQRPAENRRAPNDPQARVACCRGGRVVRPGDRPWVGSGARGLRHAVGHADTPGDQPHAALDGARMGPGVRPVAGSVAAGLCQSAPLPGALVEHRGTFGVVGDCVNAGTAEGTGTYRGRCADCGMNCTAVLPCSMRRPCWARCAWNHAAGLACLEFVNSPGTCLGKHLAPACAASCTGDDPRRPSQRGRQGRAAPGRRDGGTRRRGDQGEDG